MLSFSVDCFFGSWYLYSKKENTDAKLPVLKLFYSLYKTLDHVCAHFAVAQGISRGISRPFYSPVVQR